MAKKSKVEVTNSLIREQGRRQVVAALTSERIEKKRAE
jgi:hypothetical protein